MDDGQYLVGMRFWIWGLPRQGRYGEGEPRTIVGEANGVICASLNNEKTRRYTQNTATNKLTPLTLVN